MKNLIPVCLFLFVAFYSIAGNFTPGNIVVLRTGDGSSSLTSAATASFLDEYTTAGVLVQSIAIPTTDGGGNNACTMSGVATSEGQLSLSPNNQYLSFAGFDTTLGSSKVSSSSCNRTIGVVSTNGVINTSAGFLSGGAFNANNFRGAITNDGNEFWCSGADATSGIYYTGAGSLSAGTALGTTVTSAHYVEIFNGQLYFSSSSGTPGIYMVGTGLPTTSGQNETILPLASGSTFPANPFGFWFFDEDSTVPGPDVLYVCDDTTGLYKYSLVSGVWTANGSIANSSGIQGLTGYKTCSGVTLFISSGGGIYSLNDNSGYNGALSGSLTSIATTSTNELIRGIAFTPGSSTTSPPIVAFTDTLPASSTDSNGSITLNVSAGTPPYSYNWSNGATTQNVSGLAGAIYTVTVTDHNCNSTTQSISLYVAGINNTQWMNKFNVSLSGANLYVNADMNSELTCYIALYDMTGKAVLSESPVRTSTLAMQIPVGQVASGCYLLRIMTEQGVMSRKVIISR